MEPALRSKFNADFTLEKYAALLRCVNETEKWPADFRISETPIFLTRESTDEVSGAAKEIADLTRTPEFVQRAESAIRQWSGPPAHTTDSQTMGSTPRERARRRPHHDPDGRERARDASGEGAALTGDGASESARPGIRSAVDSSLLLDVLLPDPRSERPRSVN